MDTRLFSLASLALLACVSITAKAALISTGFETGSYASTGLTDFSTITAPTLTAGLGVGGSTGLDFASDGASGGGFQKILSAAYVSMMGRYNGNAGTANGAMGFGWSKGTVEFNPFSGTRTGVVATDHVTVAIARTGAGGFSLAAATGGMGGMTSANFFGNTVASLTSGNWYRLEGTILFDSAASAFTF